MMAAIDGQFVWILWPIVLVLCAALDGLFCGMETGLYAINKIRLELRAESGSKPARFLLHMLQRPNNLLAVLLIGTNLARYSSTFAITSMFLLGGCGDRAKWYTLAVATPLFFVVSDSVPKCVFHRTAETLSYRFAWLLRAANGVFLATGLSPLVRGVTCVLLRLTGAHRRQQSPLGSSLAAAVAEGHASGVLTQFQSAMANRVMQLKGVTVRDAMKSMQGVVRAPVTADREYVMELLQQHDYSRIPLLDNDAQVAGILNIYDVLVRDEEIDPAQAAREPLVVPVNMNVTDSLYCLQRARQTMAVVADPHGQHIGIVTIKDLVEEIVGDMEDM